MPGQVLQPAVAAALGCVLDHRRIGTRQAPAGRPPAQAQVDVLAVHVVALVEAMDLGMGLAPQQQKGGIDPVGRLARAHLVAAPQHVARQQAGGRGPAALVVLQAAGGVALHRIGQARARVGPQRVDQGRERIGAQAQVGVEHGEQRGRPQLLV